ncbi:MAG: FG-GAP-like repeat-containing protein [Planctomycetota bacterium]|nr:FG-GAP-like repeat-containing protein [Planctomycetota bacterium]
MRYQLHHYRFAKNCRWQGSPGSTRLQGESLEERRVLAVVTMPTVTMTAHEQMLLELVNRARANPLVEASRYGLGDLNQGISGAQITSVPKQPLAPHQALVNAAVGHSQNMLDLDYFSHTDLQGRSPSDRAAAAGYSAGAGENIAWGGSTGSIDQGQHVLDRHRDLFLSAGHRRNILFDTYRELGTGVRFGVFVHQGVGYNASMVTENFGNRGGNFFITGVAYRDNLVNDDFYSLGEGSNGVTITATPVTGGDFYTVVTGASGGYGLQVPAGTYTVTATGGSVNGVLTMSQIVVGSANVKVDFDTSQVGTPVTPPTPQGPLLAASRDANGSWWVTRGTTNGQSVTAVWGAWSTAVTWADVHISDVDGDGLSDIVGRTQWGNWWVARNNTDHFVNQSWGAWSHLAGWQDVQSADVNGDGRADIVGRTSSGEWWVAQSNGTSFVNQRWGAWSNSAGWQDIHVGDFDADGRDDLVGRTSWGEWWVARSTGTAYVNQPWGGWNPSAGWRNIRIGDFNGDGRDDLLGQTSSGGWWLARSTGTQFANEAWGGWSTSVVWSQILVGDVDGDGDQDLLGQTGGSWWWSRSDGNHFTNLSIGSTAAVPAGSVASLLDFDGNGRADLVFRRNSSEWWAAELTNGQLASRNWGTAASATAATEHFFSNFV